MSLDKLEERLSQAVAHFWQTRGEQLESVGGDDTQAYAGSRGAVVGGGHLNGFVELVKALLVEGGLSDACVFTKRSKTVLPGYFRPDKSWDLVVVSDGKLVATVEFKSQVGSIGNNFNNRVEEALGNATDFRTAYREGAFAPSLSPWLGYMMVLERSPALMSPVSVRSPHFKVLNEWQDASYSKRYQLFCQKLVRERLYDAACVVTSSKEEGSKGVYHEPSEEIGFKNFASALIGHAAGIAQLQRKQ